VRQLLGLLVVMSLVGCGHAAAGAQARALGGGALWTGAQAVRSLATGAPRAGDEEVLWLAAETGVTEVSADGTSREVWRAPRFVRVLRLEAMDLDGDGASEWIVTAEGSRVRSWVLRFDGAAWREGSTKRPGYMRPLQGPDGLPWLLGQSAGVERPYSGGILKLDPSDPSLRGGEPLDLPPTLSLHDVFWVPTEGGARLFAYEPTGQISELDPRSPRAQLWRSDARIVSCPVVVERQSGNLLGEEFTDRLALPVPPVVVDLDGDGAAEVLMVAGTTTPVAVLDNVRVLQGGDARVLVPGVRGLDERNRSPLLGRAMVGVVPFHRPGGRAVLAAAVWTRADTGLARPETRVMLLDPATGDMLDLDAAEPATEEPATEEPAP
jgi:hypothetical protein